MCYNSTNLWEKKKHFHLFTNKEEGQYMYQDDSLTLHTDLYQINMMQVYFNQGIHNKKAVFEVIFANNLLKTATLFLQVWNELWTT